MLIGDKRWTNIRSLKVVLIIFEVISCLKVYFHKSQLVGVSVFPTWLVEASTVMNCKKRYILFSYLGLPIQLITTLKLWKMLQLKILHASFRTRRFL